MAPKHPLRKLAQIPTPVSIGLLGGLAVVTVAVVAATAFAASGSVPNAGTVPAGATLPSTAPAAPETDAGPVAVEADTPEFRSPSMRRLLAVSADPEHVIRARVGSCPDPHGTLEVSFDGGANWQAGSPEREGATTLLQLDAHDAAIDRLVALNPECEPLVLRSFVGGVDWEADDAGGIWRVDGADARTVHTPSGEAAELPCAAAGLASNGSRAIVLCEESAVTATSDGGASWSEPVAVPFGVAVGTAAEGFIVVSGGEDDCSGTRVRGFADGVLADAGACVTGQDGRDGEVAVSGGSGGSGGSGAWVLWAGDALLRSTDRGASWE